MRVIWSGTVRCDLYLQKRTRADDLPILEQISQIQSDEDHDEGRWGFIWRVLTQRKVMYGISSV